MSKSARAQSAPGSRACTESGDQILLFSCGLTGPEKYHALAPEHVDFSVL